MRQTLAPTQTADMRERSWIALVLCLGCAPFSMPGARKTGRPTTDLKGRQPAEIRAAVGSSVTLNCSFIYNGHMKDARFGKFYAQNGRPTMSNDDIVKCRQRASKQGNLHCTFSSTITNIRLENETVYYCEVSIPKAKRIIKVTGTGTAVTLYYGPGFVNVTSDPGPVTQGSLLLPAGSPLTFSCSADGNPRPETRWLGENVTARHVGGTLQLAAVREEDGGTYWCLAKNLYGEKNASITLLVSQSQTSPGSLRLLALCVLGAVLMIFVFSLVCLLTKRMNRSPAHAQTLSDSRSEGALPPLSESQGASPDPIYSVLELSSKRARQREPVPHTVDESQPIYAEVKFPLASRNRNIREATESTIYSTVIFRNA